MDYQKLREQLLADGFDRVERDDLLLDLLTTQTRDKGIELWEKWGAVDIELIQLHEQKNPRRHVLSRAEVEALLRSG